MKLLPTQLYKIAVTRYKEITEICHEIEKRIEKYPPGIIHVIKSNGKVMYYLRTDPKDKSGKYISKKNKKEIRIYLQKKYDVGVYKILIKEKESLAKLIKKFSNVTDKIQSMYSDNPEEVKQYIIPVDVPDEEYAKEWLAIPYEGKEIDKNGTILITNRGEQVRSKSELNIANMLDKYGIPYKYECPLKLMNGWVIYPDFTVLNERTRKLIYWEHRGMMDDIEYSIHAVQRIKTMSKSGINLGENLILTEETQKSALGTDEIERIIKLWLK